MEVHGSSWHQEVQLHAAPSDRILCLASLMLLGKWDMWGGSLRAQALLDGTYVGLLGLELTAKVRAEESTGLEGLGKPL